MTINLFGGFSGINLRHKQLVHSVTFGGTDVNGVFDADQVVLSMLTNSYSPLVFRAFGIKTTGMTVVVDGYKPNVNGAEVKFITLTFTGVEIVGFHFAGTTHAKALDTVRFTFGGVSLDWDLTNSIGGWEVPA
jgi:type VI protein secretion system component Hcp